MLTYGGIVEECFLPTPDSVVRVGIAGIDDGSLILNTAVSVGEIMAGFVLASVIAVLDRHCTARLKVES